MSLLGIKNPFRTGAGSAVRAASDAVAERQGRAGNLTTLIGNTFSDPAREARTQDFMGALRSQLGDTTDRGFAEQARKTKFATARSGLTGGSTDLYRQNLNLQDLFRRRIGNEAQVQDAGNQLRTQDRATKQSLINGAYGAADVGQDAERSLIGEQGANQASMSSLLPGSLYGLGHDLAGAFGRRAMMGDFRRGLGGYTSGYAAPWPSVPAQPFFSTGDF